MDKRRLHHLWTITRNIKPQYALVGVVVFGTVCVYSLRENNLQMAKLRDAVYAADKSGTGVEPALQKLQVFVSAHMNTNLAAGPNAPYPPLQLQYTYDRAVQAAGAEVNTANAKIYTDAQKYCEPEDSDRFFGPLPYRLRTVVCR